MRKRMMMLFMAAVVALSLGALVAFAGDSPSQICKANGDFGLSHDTCVVCVAQGALIGPLTPTCSCKILADEGGLADFGFANLGQCVSSGFILP
jgi:hypothetical protein